MNEPEGKKTTIRRYLILGVMEPHFSSGASRSRIQTRKLWIMRLVFNHAAIFAKKGNLTHPGKPIKPLAP
jgi:hypothetical protein